MAPRTPGSVLDGLTIVEVSAFIAAPMAGMTLAQLGAEVIRVDPLEGGLDHHRWPVTEDGYSMYWAGLNKGKRSVAVDMRTDEGRQVVRRLVTAAGEGRGILLTNIGPAWLGYEELRELRHDVIMVLLRGSPNGRIAVDYTVNAAVGFPLITGDGASPTNQVLPAWDVATAGWLATAVLLADRHRAATGEGQLVELALSDVAMTTTSHLGYTADVEINDADRQAYGNHIYGTFGTDFVTGDRERVMVLALTPRQWRSLVTATSSETEMAEIERDLGCDLRDEGARFEARHQIVTALQPWFAGRPLHEIGELLDAHGVCWGPYQTVRRAIERDARLSESNPVFERIDQPGMGTHLAGGSPLRFGAVPRTPIRPAPALGADTDAVLGEVAGFDAGELAALRSSGVI
ncbi:MAG: CoA transferase [Acidimicrobiia bacterium]